MSEPRRCIHGRTEKQRCRKCDEPEPTTEAGRALDADRRAGVPLYDFADRIIAIEADARRAAFDEVAAAVEQVIGRAATATAYDAGWTDACDLVLAAIDRLRDGS